MEVHTMKADYSITGKNRKDLVNAIAAYMGEKPKYLGMPTAAYEIGDITVDKEGCVNCEDEAKLERMIHSLIADGFTPTAQAFSQTKETESAAESIETNESTGLTISLPASSASVENLKNLLAAKGALIKKALGIDDISIKIEDDKILFSWFDTLPTPDEVKVYTHFIAALCKMSKGLKRISAAEHETSNEKYAFRCFLLRLGFIGNDYKKERKILLKNLSGNSSWKNGAPEKEAAVCE
jgi:hypothetical protein